MLDMQRSHFEAFKTSEEKYFEFMEKMVSEQQKSEENERQKDREFFLELAKVFKQ